MFLTNKKKHSISSVFYAKIVLITILLFCCHTGFASEYNSFGRRDPFVPLVGVPRQSTRGGMWSIFSIDDVVLQGIVTNPDGTRSAVINGEVIKEGEGIEQVFIESISNNSVTITIDGETHELKLYEKD